MKMVFLILAAAVVFIGASGGAWWLKNHYLQPDAQVADKDGSPANQTVAGLPVPNKDDQTQSPDDELPVSIRPKDVSVEEMLRLGMSLNEREKRIAKAEDALQAKVVQQQIAFAEVTAEQAEIDGLRKEVADQLTKGEQFLSQLMQSRQAVIDERAATEKSLEEMKAAQGKVDEQQQANTKRLSLLLQSMDEDKGAEVLVEMANDGHLAEAAELLSLIEERDAAKLLSAIPDKKLVQDLVVAFRNLQTIAKTANNRN